MVKGKLVPVRVMKAFRGSRNKDPLIFNVGARRARCEWSNSLRGHFAPAERTPVAI